MKDFQVFCVVFCCDLCYHVPRYMLLGTGELTYTIKRVLYCLVQKCMWIYTKPIPSPSFQLYHQIRYPTRCKSGSKSNDHARPDQTHPPKNATLNPDFLPSLPNAHHTLHPSTNLPFKSQTPLPLSSRNPLLLPTEPILRRLRHMHEILAIQPPPTAPRIKNRHITA